MKKEKKKDKRTKKQIVDSIFKTDEEIVEKWCDHEM